MACKDVRLIRLVDLGPIDVPRFFELQDRFQLLRDERLVEAGGKGLWVLHRSGACQAPYANCCDPSKRLSVPRGPTRQVGPWPASQSSISFTAGISAGAQSSRRSSSGSLQTRSECSSN